jgi:hypothetical protein
MSFFVTNNVCYNVTLTANLTSSITTGTPANGNILLLNFTQDATGGRTFSLPPNFIIPTGTIFPTAPLSTNYLAFKFDGTSWTFWNNTNGAGGGSPAIGPVGTLQASNGLNAFQATGEIDTGTLLNISREIHPLGPDPYTDVTLYGVRSVTGVPAIPGITATINSGSSSATISAASTFQNGDGVSIPGAGTACALTTPSAPTITPSVAASGTGTGLIVNAPAGSTSYSYAIIARDKQGCLTAASSSGSTSTGSASLGSQSVSVSGYTRSLFTVTATTSSAHGLSVGSMVYLSNSTVSDNLYFGGWYVVQTVPDTTHFTFVTPNDVADGAPSTSAGGGTAIWFNANHVTWTPVTGATDYYIYGRTSGSLTLLGVSRPQNAAQSITDATWDDFGATMMSGILLPYFVPSTPPVASLSRPLVTTILSGAGTTTLTLASPAGTSVSGATILFDNTPNIQTAAAATTFGSLLYFPQSANSYPVNSYLTIPADVSISLAGSTLLLNDTMELGSGDKLFGMLGAQSNSTTQFGWPTGGFISVNRANPGLWNVLGSNLYMEGLTISGAANGQLLAVIDGGGGGGQNFIHNTNFVDGGSGDYMGMNVLLRGGFWNRFDTVTLGTGPGQVGGGFAGSTATPALYANTTGSMTFRNMSVQDRGIFFIPSAAGANVEFTGTSRAQGIITPFFTSSQAVGIAGVNYTFSDVEIDTSNQALFANLPTTGAISGRITVVPGVNGLPTNGFGAITGTPILGLVLGAASGQNAAAISGPNFTNNPVNVTGNGEFLYPLNVTGTPGAVVSAGGSVPVGSSSYVVTYLDINGSESTQSNFTNVTTTTGNQTVTITPPAAPAGAVTWRPYRCFANGQSCVLANITTCSSSLSFSTTFVDTFSFTCGNAVPTTNFAGSQTLSQQGLSGTTFNLVNSGFKNSITGTFTANRTLTVPDASGVIAEPGLQQTWLDHQSIANGKELRFFSNDLAHWAGFKGGASTSNLIWLFPTTDSTGTQCLSSNGSLQLAWSNCSAGTGTPGGANTQVQINNVGTFGASANLTFVSPTLTIGSAEATTGSLAIAGATSGVVTITAQATSGAPTLTLPNTTGTLADGASSPLALSATTGNLTCPTCTTNAAAATTNQLMLGSGAQAIAALGSLGTTTTLLHGNAGGAPSFSAVTLTTDVTGSLPIANGGCAGTTAATCFNNVSPITSTGDLILGNGASSATRLPIGGNGLCLTSNGTTAAWASCAAGAVGGSAVAGQGTFWNGTATVAGSANWTYSAASGHSITQGSNATDSLYQKRFTDTSPTGNFLHFQNAAANTDLFKIDVLGNVTAQSLTFNGANAGGITLSQGTAPALVANAIELIAPTAVAASGEQFAFPGTPSTGFIRWTNVSGVLTGAFAAASGIGVCTNQVVTQTNDNAAPTCTSVTGSMFVAQPANTGLMGPTTGPSATPGFRAFVSADIPAINLASGGNGGVTGLLPIANGGCNASTASTCFNNIWPGTTAGDIVYGGALGVGTRLAAGTATQVLHSGSTPSWSSVSLTTDVSGTLPIANGGTGQTTASAAFNALAPAASANALIYSNGTNTWTSLAAGGAGTLCLTEASGGTPTWGSCAGSAGAAWSALTNPTGNLALTMGTNTSTFTSGVLTGTNGAWSFLDGNSTSTGNFFAINTGTTSTAKPLTVTAQGTANGVQMTSAGSLGAIGTGAIVATSLNQALNTTSPLTGGGTQTSALTLACATCVTSASALANNSLVFGSGGAQGTATSANLSFVSPTLTIGVAASTTGQLALTGSTSGTVTVQPGSATAGTYNFNLPTSAGTAKQLLISGGGSATAQSYIDFPDIHIVPAANCNNTTAGAGWSIGSGGTVTCRAGTNNLGGFISITDTSSTFATFQIAIPEDWDTGSNPFIRFQLASTDATNAHTIIPSIQVACYKGDGSTTDDVAANAAHSLSTVTLNGNANRFWSTSNVQMNSTDVTGCVAGALMQVTVGRATDTATNAEFYSATITFPRLLTVQAN